MSDKFKDYVCTYRHRGVEWGITVRAESEADCRERLKAMGLARIDGHSPITIPGWMPMWVIDLVARTMSLFGRRS